MSRPTRTKGVAINFDDIQFRQKYSGWKAYQQSKLANILFTYELARRIDGTKCDGQHAASWLREHELFASLQRCASGLVAPKACSARGAFAGAGGSHLDLPGICPRGRGNLRSIFRQGKARNQLPAIA